MFASGSPKTHDMMVNSWAVTRSASLKGLEVALLGCALACGLLYSLPGDDIARGAEPSHQAMLDEVHGCATTDEFVPDVPVAYGSLPTWNLSRADASGAIPSLMITNSVRAEAVQMKANTLG